MTHPKPARVPIRPSQLVNPEPAQATLAATATEWIANALRLELPDGTPEPEIAECAEVLHAIAINWDIPIEAAIAWIHAPAPEKEWTGGEFRRWAQRWRAERREYEWSQGCGERKALEAAPLQRQAIGDTEHNE